MSERPIRHGPTAPARLQDEKVGDGDRWRPGGLSALPLLTWPGPRWYVLVAQVASWRPHLTSQATLREPTPARYSALARCPCRGRSSFWAGRSRSWQARTNATGRSSPDPRTAGRAANTGDGRAESRRERAPGQHLPPVWGPNEPGVITASQAWTAASVGISWASAAKSMPTSARASTTVGLIASAGLRVDSARARQGENGLASRAAAPRARRPDDPMRGAVSVFRRDDCQCDVTTRGGRHVRGVRVPAVAATEPGKGFVVIDVARAWVPRGRLVRHPGDRPQPGCQHRKQRWQLSGQVPRSGAPGPVDVPRVGRRWLLPHRVQPSLLSGHRGLSGWCRETCGPDVMPVLLPPGGIRRPVYFAETDAGLTVGTRDVLDTRDATPLALTASPVNRPRVSGLRSRVPGSADPHRQW